MADAVADDDGADMDVDRLDTSRYRLLYDILRFNHTALDVLSTGDLDTTVSEYLEKEGYSPVFRDRYLLVSIHSFSGKNPHVQPGDQCSDLARA